jgi:uncharacterized protein (TIGR01244 family)
MTKFNFLNPTLAVAGVLDPADFARIAKLGFKTVINNRPDGEEAGQATASEEAELAARAGLAYLYLPVAKHEVLDDHVINAQAVALSSVRGPVLVHCRSGLRSTILWAVLAVEAGATIDQVLAIATAAGLDLGSVRDEIAERAVSRQAAGSAHKAAA